MNFLNVYKKWLESDLVDEKLKEELRGIANNNLEIEDRFYKNLSFGTAGLRGKMGAGTNRMNCLVIAKTTQAYANYLKKIFACDIRVVIAYDSRNHSKEFAFYAAKILSANGIAVYIFDSLRPTPELSYAVRKLLANGGINITASHNPKEYNGYKVYNENGGQIIEEEAASIMEEIDKLDFSDIVFEENKNLINVIDDDFDNDFIEEISNVLYDDINERDVKIVYNPLFGAGTDIVPRSLRTNGFNNIYIDESMSKPNGDFPGLELPNPEFLDVYKSSVKIAFEVNADIVIATDPDSDRIGLMAYSPFSESYELLTGNEVGALCIDYIMHRLHKNDAIPANASIVNTIVTNDLGQRIAENYGVKTEKTLTGFKYISDYIQKYHGKTSSFLFGYEDTCGYLAHPEIRDKDAVQIALLVAEMADYYKKRGRTLINVMREIYTKYGFVFDKTISYKFEGVLGKQSIEKIMDFFRTTKPDVISGYKIVKLMDLDIGLSYDMVNGDIANIELPKSNVMKFIFDDSSWFAVRPSGTEPKLKIYFSILGENEVDVVEKYNKIYEGVSNLIRLEK